MNIINFFFVLTILIVPSVPTESDTPPCIVCGFGGQMAPTAGFQFSTSDVLDRCEAVHYGFFYFDRQPNSNDDINAILSLKAEHKIVYVFVGFNLLDAWETIIDSNETFDCNKNILSLKRFLNTTMVNGIILQTIDLYAGTVTDYAKKMNTFILYMKEEISTLKIGLSINGYDYEKFSETKIFDFSITNAALDIYLIDLSGGGVYNCDANTTIINPIKLVEEISKAASESAMEKNKLSVIAAIYTVKEDTITQLHSLTTYSDFCSSSNTSNTTNTSVIWCKDTTDTAYNQGKLLKQYYQGIWLLTLDTDDFQASCNCEKFPVSNIFLDGWQSKPKNNCLKLDKK